jgi:hypothetical protein
MSHSNVRELLEINLYIASVFAVNTPNREDGKIWSKMSWPVERVIKEDKSQLDTKKNNVAVEI